jgi:predicted anti-sigma-YlaC factor YlaD
MHGECERARQWASADLDDEVSTFERALLDDHLAGCASCSEFRAAIGGLTGTLRAAPRERLEGVVIGRVRRQVRLRLAPAVAAMAVAAVGLGSVLASSAIHLGSVGRVSSQQIHATPAILSAPDTMNLSTSRALQRLRTVAPAADLRSTSSRSLRGGPVVRER